MPLLSEPLATIRRDLMACSKCPALGSCVPPVGPSNPSLFIIGQAPWETEVDVGIPFCGESGKLLDELLAAANIPRSTCFISNAVACQLPKDRRPCEPTTIELDNCRPFLVRQLLLLRPSAVLCLGRDAYRIFSKRVPWGDGIVIKTKTRLLLSYHPSYWLRNNNPAGFLAIAPKLKELVYGN